MTETQQDGADDPENPGRSGSPTVLRWPSTCVDRLHFSCSP